MSKKLITQEIQKRAEIASYLEESKNLEELALRTSLIEVPPGTIINLNDQTYIYHAGNWYHSLVTTSEYLRNLIIDTTENEEKDINYIPF
jgi:hypothetical protein